jgi:hypothetical protein
MEESSEGHGAIVLALYEEIHAQPQAVVGSPEAHLKEELAGAEMRVRDEIQELRGLAEERLQCEVEQRAAGCDEKEEESLSSGGAKLKKKRELPEDAGHEREEPKMPKMGSDDEDDGGRLQPVVLETLSPQLDDDDKAEVVENSIEPEKKRERDEDNVNGDEEEEEKLKQQKMQKKVDELRQEKGAENAVAPLVELPSAAVGEGSPEAMVLGSVGDEIQQEQRQDVEDEEGCMYNCLQVAGKLVQCDDCEQWFHPLCAGYERGLLDNPNYDGHPIELKAYCRECLDDLKLSHVDIVQQEREYLLLEKFFQANAGSWIWQPVPRNGLCLSKIWEKYPVSFKSLDALIAAAAIASIEEVDRHAEGSPAEKRHCKAVFSDLAQHPDKLADMWPDLEVQCIWHALVNSVFKDLKLSVYALDDHDEIAQLRCIQTIPDDSVHRVHTINLLQWNVKVARHYDLLEEVVAINPPPQVGEAMPGRGAEIGEGVVAVQEALAVVAEVAEAVSSGLDPHANSVDASSDTGEEEEDEEEADEKAELASGWKSGALLEAEMMDPDYPNYRDTLHPVRVVDVLDGGKKYRCQLLAFAGENNEDEWDAEFLHDPREHDKNAKWEKGDMVHFRLRNRKVGKSKVDGAVSEKGIWAKGVVAESQCKENDRVVVEHVAWGSGGDGGELLKKLSHVFPVDVRWAEARPYDDMVFQKEVGRTGPF